MVESTKPQYLPLVLDRFAPLYSRSPGSSEDAAEGDRDVGRARVGIKAFDIVTPALWRLKYWNDIPAVDSVERLKFYRAKRALGLRHVGDGHIFGTICRPLMAAAGGRPVLIIPSDVMQVSV